MMHQILHRAAEKGKKLERNARNAGIDFRGVRGSDVLLISILLLLLANLYFNSYTLRPQTHIEKSGKPPVTNINVKLTNHWGKVGETSVSVSNGSPETSSDLDLEEEDKDNTPILEAEFTQSVKLVEQRKFAHRAKRGGQPKALFLAIRNTCCWFHIKQLKAFRNVGFSTQLIKHDSVRDINQKAMANLNFISSYDAWICLARYECWNPYMYKKLEGRTKTNKILFVKQILSTKNNFCSTVKKALRASTSRGLQLLQKFTFDCYVLPLDYQELQNRANAHPDMKWIVKPQASQAGAGIFVRNGENIQTLSSTKDYVVQPFLQNPLLLDNRKFDMRIHVTVTNMLPLRAYMHEFGIVRFAAHEYDREASNGGKKSQFLTNISVNNKIKKTDELTWLLPQLKAELGEKAAIIFERIEKAMAMVLVASESVFREKYDGKVSKDFACRNCYQTLGMDVILDDNLNAYIIEVNGHPTQDFTAEKLNEGARNMNVHLADMFYKNMKANVSDQLLNDLSKASGLANLDDEFGWLDIHQKEYLVASKKEQAEMGEYRRIYPPTIVSQNIESEWEQFMEHLDIPESRKRFHKLLVDLQKVRVANCLGEGLECSNEIYDRCTLYKDAEICDQA